MNKNRSLSVLVILVLGVASLPLNTAHAATYTVTTTNDVLDAAATCSGVSPGSLPGPDGFVSLREAICAANNNPGSDTITFNIPGAGVRTIRPTRPLPFITDERLFIDGYTQPSASRTHDETPATIMIELDGSSAGASNGITITSQLTIIRGLAINRFSGNGIAIINLDGRVAYTNSIVGNHIGTTASGSVDRGNGLNGVYIGWGAVNNTIGAGTPGDRNIISGNGWSGVEIHGAGTAGNWVKGNFIGTMADGITPLGNSMFGVRIYGGARTNGIGGFLSGDRNVISGNELDGIRIIGEGTNVNSVEGNYIGISQYGIAQAGNGENGVLIGLGAQYNTIGGFTVDRRNVISANNLYGIRIIGEGTNRNRVEANYIGIDATGTARLGNGRSGVTIGGGAQDNIIGGDEAAQRNIISANSWDGIEIHDPGTMYNTVSGNYIGTNAAGTGGLGNSGPGVLIASGGKFNQIGGTSFSERNVISDNLYGVFIIQAGAESNRVSGNYIGLDKDGELLGNLMDGVVVALGAKYNIVGGVSEGERNIISGNGEHGIRIALTGASENRVIGNYIGLDPEGIHPRGNVGCGIYLKDGPQQNEIGPHNVISANHSGVCLAGVGTMNNVVLGNIIGTNADMTAPLGNNFIGIEITEGAQNNIIGGDSGEDSTPGISNLISGNLGSGVLIGSAGTSGNTVMGNIIGQYRGLGMGNGEDGVRITTDGADNIIGPNNLIFFNRSCGVRVRGTSTSGNRITQNRMGFNAHQGIHLQEGGNGDISPPVITTLTADDTQAYIEGTACPGCTIEIFSNFDEEGEGNVFVGTLSVNGSGTFSGNFVPYLFLYVTATATDPILGTSQFSEVYTIQILNPIFLPIVIR
jgi:hypothetical protein